MDRTAVNPFLNRAFDTDVTPPGIDPPAKKRGKRPIPEEMKIVTTKEERGDDSGDPCEIVSLSGYGLTKNGEIVERNFFANLKEFVSPDNDMLMSRKDAIKLQRYMLGLSTGSAALVPLQCTGPRCPMSSVCPFLNELDVDVPIGRACPIEMELVKHKKRLYIDEYQIDLKSPTLLSYIDELVTIEIYEFRIAAQLAKEQDSCLTAEATIGVDKEGEPIMSRQISPLVEVKDRLAARKTVIIRRLVGDPFEKKNFQAKLRQRTEGDAATNWASTRDSVEALRAMAIEMKQAGDVALSNMAKPTNSSKPDVIDVEK